MHRLWPSFVFSVLICYVFVTASDAQTRQIKPLATGVLKKIPSDLDPRDSFSLPMRLPGMQVDTYDPKFLPKSETLYELTRRVIMFRDVWEYEFSFVGELRQARLQVPNLKTGQTQPKNVWYLLYRIRDLGSTLTYDQVKQNPDFDHIMFDLKRNETIAADKKFFLPQFVLEGSIIKSGSEGYQKVSVNDTVSPMVLRQIQRLEDPNMTLLDPITMSQTNIPLAKNDSDGGVWGVAVFENVDPRIDYVSVFVNGLTNAYRINPDPNQPHAKKTLQLNFWRPGDIVAEESDSIDYGIPLVDDPAKQVLIAERYNLPGPLIRGYVVNKDAANLKVLVVETDAKIDLKTFRSELTPTLDTGTLPQPVAQAFSDADVPVTGQTQVKTIVAGQRWEFTEGGNQYVLSLEPQFWERIEDKNDVKIRFIKSLDHLWIYR